MSDTGFFKQENGYYYNLSSGPFAGSVSNGTGSTERVFACAGKSATGFFLLPQKIALPHKEFQTCANIIKEESGTAGIECIYFAFTASNWAKRTKTTIYPLLMSDYSSVPKSKKIPLPDTPPAGTQEDAKAGWARKGLLQAQLGAADPTNGATHWDGTDFLAWGLKNTNGVPHAKFRQYKKITMAKALYDTYLAGNLKVYKSGQVPYGGKPYPIPAAVFLDKKNWATGDFVYVTGAKSTQSLVAMVAAGHSIFWKAVNG